ncbi:branched-chain amino acid ABC transporter permease [Mesorhizobium australicum]|nr:branched-chain amino acid ABC transporter permease [Mesorhizobium australicum]
MDTTITLFLLQDGTINGAIYALLSVAFVLLFTVTRIIFIPQGDFVAYGGLTLAALERGETPGSVWLLLAMGIVAGLIEMVRERHRLNRRRLTTIVALDFILPAALVAMAVLLAPLRLTGVGAILLTLAIIVPMGSYIYRICFRPLSDASILVLLIASVGVHWLLTGLGLVFFGAEGYRTTSLVATNFTVGPLFITGQSVLMLLTTVAILAALYLFFGRTLAGKALRASAVNGRGARLVGISPYSSGQLAFAMATFIGAVSGVLISPMTTLYYDSGFLIGLKGFIAAIVGGFASYPLAVVAALFIGLSEAFAAFWASAFKEVIVFSLIIPILLWLSLRSTHVEED